MISGLNGLDASFLSKEYDSINSVKNKINSSKDDISFKDLLKEKMNSNGTVNPNKLDKREKKLYDSCVEMESLLWKQVLNSMKQTINKYKMLDGGQGEEIFSDFLYDEYAMMMAKNSNTKISDQLFMQLSGYNR